MSVFVAMLECKKIKLMLNCFFFSDTSVNDYQILYSTVYSPMVVLLVLAQSTENAILKYIHKHDQKR